MDNAIRFSYDEVKKAREDARQKAFRDQLQKKKASSTYQPVVRQGSDPFWRKVLYILAHIVVRIIAYPGIIFLTGFGVIIFMLLDIGLAIYRACVRRNERRHSELVEAIRGEPTARQSAPTSSLRSEEGATNAPSWLPVVLLCVGTMIMGVCLVEYRAENERLREKLHSQGEYIRILESENGH